MKTWIVTGLLVAGLSAAHALDLTPITSYRELEGVRIPVISFEDGLRKVNWQPPDNWQLSGGGQQLNLYPEKIALAAAQLKLIGHDAAQIPARTGALNDFLKWAMSFVPRDATGLTFDHESPNPFLLGGKPSREITVSYVSSAKKCSTSVALVDLDARQSLALVITACTEDFEQVYSAGTASMFRWQWITKPLTPQDVTASNAPASKAPR